MSKALKWVLLLLAILVVAIVAMIIVVLQAAPQKAQLQAVPDYLGSQWATFRVEQYDEDAKTLTLAYDVNVTYEQAVKYGADTYTDVAQGHITTVQTLKNGCASACGVVLQSVTVSGYSSDGKLIYTVADDGRITACWD